MNEFYRYLKASIMKKKDQIVHISEVRKTIGLMGRLYQGQGGAKPPHDDFSRG